MKLTKEEIKTRDALITKLNGVKGAVEVAVERYNTAMRDAWSDLKTTLDEFDEVREEADNWRTDMVSSMESFRDDKSEKWQEGENGERHGEWISKFEDADLPEIALSDDPEEFDVPEEVSTCVEAFTEENLPDGPDGA